MTKLRAALAYAFMPAALLAASVFSPVNAAPPADPYPHLVLDNGQMTLTVYLPDAGGGYYRGTRFDWSGLIRRADYRGHAFYGPWQPAHDPTTHDAVVGPAEEFGMKGPLGYGEARPGQPFYKIGVGVLRKPEEAEYQFFGSYALAAPPEWTVTHGRTWIEFRQTLHGERGWGYRYVKRLELMRNAPVFLLTHRLENLGTRRIETDQYCHNFTVIDGEPVGPGYRVQFPFDLHPRTPQPFGDAAAVTGGRITFTRPLPPGQALYGEFPAPPGATGFEVENVKSQASVSVQSSLPAAEYHLYAVASAVCPEPFLRLSLDPGRRLVWRTRYTFCAPAPPAGQISAARITHP